MTYKIKFIDSFRFMSSSLSCLVDNLSEALHCDECIYCEAFPDYMITKDDQLIAKCFECNYKNYKKNFNKDLIKRFSSTDELCDRYINQFILLLRKGVYPCEYMDSWGRFDEELLPDKGAFYSILNMEDYYRHAKRVYKEF